MKPEGYNLTKTGELKCSMTPKFEALDRAKPTRSAFFLSSPTKVNFIIESRKEGSTTIAPRVAIWSEHQLKVLKTVY